MKAEKWLKLKKENISVAKEKAMAVYYENIW